MIGRSYSYFCSQFCIGWSHAALYLSVHNLIADSISNYPYTVAFWRLPFQGYGSGWQGSEMRQFDRGQAAAGLYVAARGEAIIIGLVRRAAALLRDAGPGMLRPNFVGAASTKRAGPCVPMSDPRGGRRTCQISRVLDVVLCGRSARGLRPASLGRGSRIGKKTGLGRCAGPCEGREVRRDAVAFRAARGA